MKGAAEVGGSTEATKGWGMWGRQATGVAGLPGCHWDVLQSHRARLLLNAGGEQP